MSSQESRVYRLASRGHRAKKASAGIATPQPDGMLIIEPATGGQIGLSEDDFTTGPPELIVGVASRPLFIVLQDYPNAMTLESNKSATKLESLPTGETLCTAIISTSERHKRASSVP